MPDNIPHTIGPTLEELLDQVVFSDPATHPIRAEWERTKAEEQAVFDQVFAAIGLKRAGRRTPRRR